MTTITLVPVNDIDRTWPEVAECFRRACEYGGNVTPAWLYQMCRNGEAMLFRIDGDTAFIGRFVDNDTAFKFEALGGHRIKEWMPHLRQWQWPRQFGVTRIIFETERDGLAALVTGARKRFTSYEVELADAG